jgi:methyl-accepting chemotaxis protein
VSLIPEAIDRAIKYAQSAINASTTAVATSKKATTDALYALRVANEAKELGESTRSAMGDIAQHIGGIATSLAEITRHFEDQADTSRVMLELLQTISKQTRQGG